MFEEEIRTVNTSEDDLAPVEAEVIGKMVYLLSDKKKLNRAYLGVLKRIKWEVLHGNEYLGTKATCRVSDKNLGTSIISNNLAREVSRET